MSRTPELDASILRFADLLILAANSSAQRHLFQTATGVTAPASSIDSLNVLARRARTGAELAEELGIDVTQSSRQVAALVAAGFVCKRRSPADRRQVVIALSVHGQDVMQRWQSNWLLQFRSPLLVWSTRDVTAFGSWMLDVAERLVTDRVRLAYSDTPLVPRELDYHPEVDRCLTAVANFVYLVGRTDIDKVLRATHVPLRGHEFFALQDIALSDAATVTDVSQHIDIGHPAASRAISRLAEDGLVHKDRTGSDRREVRVTLSEAGRALLSRIRQARLAEISLAFDDLSPRTASRNARLTNRYLDELLRTADSSAQRYG
ncbi:MarR family transcriptional regulator [Rhodococcus qingshengii]|uniref:MarR family transcriptional regulator n=1 Tax=Rhodococcus qingshengii TaxID=334542 RepID=UPI001BE8FA3E|nr:MarR family transcriptional regulator [Rhodococcus qingshengii]MBT2272037.1 winged helix DNA-binding protein [Rhodococcus qingshengii]